MTLPDATAHLAAGLVGIASGIWAGRAEGPTPPRRRVVVATASATLGAVLGMGLATQRHPVLMLLASLLLMAVALPLSVTDFATRTLPDRIVLPAVLGVVVLLALGAAQVSDARPLERALAAGLVVFAAFTAVALAAPGQLGFGDCKTATLCALPLGYLGWDRVLLGIGLAFVLAACYVVGRRVVRSADGPDAIAFGVYLFAGTFAMLLMP